MNIVGKNILVIGGAGLIGSHIVEELLEKDIKSVTIYDNFTRGTYENIENSLLDDRCQVFPLGGDIRDVDIDAAGKRGHRRRGCEFHIDGFFGIGDVDGPVHSLPRRIDIDHGTAADIEPGQSDKGDVPLGVKRIPATVEFHHADLGIVQKDADGIGIQFAVIIAVGALPHEDFNALTGE